MHTYHTADIAQSCAEHLQRILKYPLDSIIITTVNDTQEVKQHRMSMRN